MVDRGFARAPQQAPSTYRREFAPVFFAALVLSASGVIDDAAAKGPGARYCFYGTCHRVKTIAETEALVGKEMRLSASFYDSCKSDRYNPCGLTSSGEVFHPDSADNAASPDLPDGTILLVRNPANGQTAVVRINNAGPYWGKRKLDLSRAAAEKLEFRHRGVAELDVRVIKAPTPAEARYSKGRRYEPVPGYIGRFASSDEAHVAVAVAMDIAVPQRVRIASLDGAAALLKSNDADRHGLRAALKARIKDVPQAPATVATAVESVAALRATWREAADREPSRENLVPADHHEATPLHPVPSGGLRELDANHAGGALVVLASAVSPDDLGPARPLQMASLVAAPEHAARAVESDDLAAFALFVPDREPGETLAATSRQVADWQPIKPRPSCALSQGHAAVAYLGASTQSPGRARALDLPAFRA